MFPTQHLLQLTLPRAQSALNRLQQVIWSKAGEVEVRFGGGSAEACSVAEAAGFKYEKVAVPFGWGKIFDRAWFEIDWVATEDPIYLHWREQGEATLYLEDCPHYGFDVAHRHCPLPAGVTRGRIESLCLQSAIWHPEAKGLDARGSLIEVVEICTRNDDAWAAWHDLVVLFELALEEHRKCRPLEELKLVGIGHHAPVENVPVLYRRLLRGLDDAVNALDRDGIAAMREVLARIYAALAGRHEMVNAVLTGHAHIDLVWLWPERVGEYKAVHTFATANRMLERYPEFRFGYSQPASYATVRENSPPLWNAVRERVTEGSWEPQGATEVESDTLLACGEALLRSFLVGQDRYREMFGKAATVLWLPDVFGYSGCLPQMAVESGVRHFFTTKLTWSNVNLFPHSSFRWRGIDGSTLLTHVTQENGYNQIASVAEISRGAGAYRQSDVHDEFLAPTGYGDGGGGPTEEMCERARRMQSLAGLPSVRWGRIDEFFERLETVADKLPEYQGELYLEYHRGTYTTHGELKARFRALERALQSWEAVRSATGGQPIDPRYWRRMIMAQFHDYVPGSSIWEVYEEGVPELKSLAAEALDLATAELGGAGNHVFNPLPMERTVIVDGPAGGRVAVRVPALSTAPLTETITVALSPKVERRVLQSKRVKARIADDGTLSQLEIDGRPIMQAGGLGQLWMFPDYPHNFDAWDIDRQTLSLGRRVETEVEWLGTESNGLEASLRFRRKLGTASNIITTLRVDAFAPILHFELEVEWQEEHALLKVAFPTGYQGRMARFGAPYGSVLRSQHPGQPRDEAMFESCASRWACVMHEDESDGLACITEAKYGWSCRDGTLGLSLVRSALVTGEDPNHARLLPPALRRGGARMALSDQGRHVVRFALARHHSGLPRGENPAALADAIYTPPLRVREMVERLRVPEFKGMESVIPAWVQPHADATITLRLHETLGRAGRLNLIPQMGTTIDLETAGGEVIERAINGCEIRGGQFLSLRVHSDA